MYIPLPVTHATHTQAEEPVWLKAPGDVKWERDLFSRWGGRLGGHGNHFSGPLILRGRVITNNRCEY